MFDRKNVLNTKR